MIRFLCLGSVDLIGLDGSPVEEVLVQPKRVALLSYIALFNHGGFVPRDRLLEVFWPESDTERARNSLNQALHQLRSALGEGALETRGKHELRVSRDVVWCDALEFRHAVQEGRPAEATELYHGDLLEGLHAANGGGFERWLDEERVRLRRGFCDAAWRRAEEAEAAGDAVEAVAMAREAVAKAPFDELALRRLMELLVRLGDRAEALRAYERFAERLADELEVEPDPETVELAVAIRTNGVAVAGQVSSVASPAAATSEPTGMEPFALAPAPVSPASVRSGTPWMRWPTAALGIAALAVLTFVLSTRRSGPEPASFGNLVIVQPFENLTGDESLDFVGDAAADAVALGMNTRVGDLTAVVAGDVGQFDAPDALFVTGSYTLEGDSLALTVRVASALGAPLRVEGPVTGPVQDASVALSELQDRVTVIVAQHFGSESPTDPAAPVPKWEAWRAASQGEVYSDRAEWSRALPHFQRAVEIDPEFAGAYGRLATTYANVGNWRAADSVFQMALDRRDALNPLQRISLEWFAAASANDRQERLRAHREGLALRGQEADLQLSHELISLNRPLEALDALDLLDPEAMLESGVHRYWWFYARAHHLLGDHEAELDAAQLGLKHFPGHLDLIMRRAMAMAALGRIDEVVQAVELAFGLPSHGGCCPARVPLNGGMELLAHGHPEAARRVFVLGADLDAGHPHETERDRARNVWLLLAAERWDEAAAALDELHRDQPAKALYLGGLGIVAARTGDREEAIRISEELDPSRFYGMEKPQTTLFRARIAAVLGEDDRAMRLLRDATAGGLAIEEALHQPEFAELRNTDAFQRWAQPVG